MKDIHLDTMELFLNQLMNLKEMLQEFIFTLPLGMKI